MSVLFASFICGPSRLLAQSGVFYLSCILTAEVLVPATERSFGCSVALAPLRPGRGALALALVSRNGNERKGKKRAGKGSLVPILPLLDSGPLWGSFHSSPALCTSPTRQRRQPPGAFFLPSAPSSTPSLLPTHLLNFSPPLLYPLSDLSLGLGLESKSLV